MNDQRNRERNDQHRKPHTVPIRAAQYLRMSTTGQQ